ncbi:uncharacterized protein EI90DRAFT_3050344 [Cantharellus anzutake]|uniref:uncharacterized protein n=1 Tax=Cantharellus anzutake TaxID=1750568 RepID=UPI001905988C|nr:uncharacterized protein EI90DRAFT_3050344 [Cantharellus anzutake]KAF8333934.1 hypothetical protein EI90DRAFT_3050344 [Cantharellus anzutake]
MEINGYDHPFLLVFTMSLTLMIIFPVHAQFCVSYVLLLRAFYTPVLVVLGQP